MVKSYVPETLKETLELLDKGKYQIVAGGTDMLIQNHARSPLPINYKNDIIYISNLEELKGITEDDDFIYIGACTSLEEIMEHKLTPKLLKDTILEMASPAIRHTGTLAGNIGNASPAGDSLVTLYLLNADVQLQSLNNTRRMCIRDFITGVRKIDLKPNEIITKVIINKINFDKAEFIKVGPRRSDAISKLSFAYGITFHNNQTIDFRIAFGAVNTTVVRHPEIECQYIRKTKEELKESIEEIITAYRPFIKPIDDQRSNKAYRRQVCENLLREFILEL
ncbi:xanthine dehydrogenase family protein subunit M [Candidatus Izemoplasma sp. B36]|uniref:FAD binding domain-containing protein n=1 Tax=Candidatus Izemoplasma sp. B36 TaxID=3242468 RepID=UPI003556F4E7